MPPEIEVPQTVPIGVQIMADLVTNLVVANENAKVTHEMMRELVEVETEKVKLLDDLNGHFEAFAMACNEVAELSQEKGKVTLVDFCQAFAKAEAEVFADEEPE